jgi:putative redox protein
MADNPAHRTVTVERAAEGVFTVTRILPDAVNRSHDRLCTVGRTVELGTPITTKIE